MPLHTHLSFISELPSTVPHGGNGEYIHTKLALYGSKNECVRTVSPSNQISAHIRNYRAFQICKTIWSPRYIGHWEA